MQSKEVFLATHTNPDGDAIGSLLAMGMVLEALNKTVTLFNESQIPAVYRFLPTIERITNEVNGNAGEYDTAVILDCGNLGRIGRGAAMAAEIPVLINIDHHVTNTGFGDYQHIDIDACASAEIVYQLIGALKVPITLDMATVIYTAILTDTGSFRFSNTNRAAFKICEKMIGLGVKPHKIAQHVYGQYSMGRIKLLNLALDSIEISKNGKLSMMLLTQEMLSKTGTYPEDGDGLINYAKRIQDIKVAVLIQEQKNGTNSTATPYHISLRSDGSVDVAAIASAFGGGGHSSAAGFSVKSTLPELKSHLFKLAESI